MNPRKQAAHTERHPIPTCEIQCVTANPDEHMGEGWRCAARAAGQALCGVELMVWHDGSMCYYGRESRPCAQETPIAIDNTGMITIVGGKATG